MYAGLIGMYFYDRIILNLHSTLQRINRTVTQTILGDQNNLRYKSKFTEQVYNTIHPRNLQDSNFRVMWGGNHARNADWDLDS